MPKELYLYSQIYDFVAENLISQMEDHQGEDIVIRSCCPGGSVFAGWGIIAKMNEHKGHLKIKADGLVASMGLYMLLFCDDVEALDVTNFVLHRANMYVGDPEDQTFLDGINAQLKDKLTAKIDVKKLKELKGVSIKDIFNPEAFVEVKLTASEAKQIGLINKIQKITPAVKAELKSFNDKFQVAANYSTSPVAEKQIEQQKPTKMNLEKLKSENPALYAEVIALGVAQGVAQEKDRVESILAFNDVDPVAVKAAIEGGKNLSQKQISEFTLKAISATALKNVADDSTKGPAATGAAPTALSDKDKVIAAFEAEVDGKKPETEKK